MNSSVIYEVSPLAHGVYLVERTAQYKGYASDDYHKVKRFARGHKVNGQEPRILYIHP